MADAAHRLEHDRAILSVACAARRGGDDAGGRGVRHKKAGNDDAGMATMGLREQNARTDTRDKEWGRRQSEKKEKYTPCKRRMHER